MTNKKRIAHLEDLLLSVVRASGITGLVSVPPTEDNIIDAILKIRGTECEGCGGIFNKAKMKEVTVRKEHIDGMCADYELLYCPNCAPNYNEVVIELADWHPSSKDKHTYYKIIKEHSIEVTEKGKKL